MDPVNTHRIGPMPSTPSQAPGGAARPDASFQVGAPTSNGATEKTEAASPAMVESIRAHSLEATSERDLVQRVVTDELRAGFGDDVTPAMVDAVSDAVMQDPSLRALFQRVAGAAGRDG